MTKNIAPMTRAFEGVDFEIEIDKKKKVCFITPVSYLAYDWSYGAPDGAGRNSPLRTLDQKAWFPMFTPGAGYPRQAGLHQLTRIGRSFMASESQRAQKLRTYLKHNFNVHIKVVA